MDLIARRRVLLAGHESSITYEWNPSMGLPTWFQSDGQYELTATGLLLENPGTSGWTQATIKLIPAVLETIGDHSIYVELDFTPTKRTGYLQELIFIQTNPILCFADTGDRNKIVTRYTSNRGDKIIGQQTANTHKFSFLYQRDKKKLQIFVDDTLLYDASQNYDPGKIKNLFVIGGATKYQLTLLSAKLKIFK